MATIDFPSNPSVNDYYTFNNKTWVFNGQGWQLASTGAINGIIIGNATPAAGNFTTLGATGNIITSSGNISGTYILGNGAFLTGIVSGSTYSNSNVAAYLPTYTGNLVSLTGNIITTGNVSGSYLLGNGSQLTGISSGGATIADDTTTNSNYYPVFATATSGSLTTATISSTKLTFNPSTGQLTAVDVNTSSDAKYKENVQPIASALDTINSIQGVSFNWKETGQRSYGVIAQDLIKVLPELVHSAERGLTVSYLPLIAILIEAIKEQQQQIDQLKNTKPS